jgi:hypothetical protein
MSVRDRQVLVPFQVQEDDLLAGDADMDVW